MNYVIIALVAMGLVNLIIARALRPARVVATSGQLTPLRAPDAGRMTAEGKK